MSFYLPKLLFDDLIMIAPAKRGWVYSILLLVNFLDLIIRFEIRQDNEKKAMKINYVKLAG